MDHTLPLQRSVKQGILSQDKLFVGCLLSEKNSHLRSRRNHVSVRAKRKSCGDNLIYRWVPFMIKIIIPILSHGLNSDDQKFGKWYPNDDQKHTLAVNAPKGR
jgi:hypothetical protein